MNKSTKKFYKSGRRGLLSNYLETIGIKTFSKNLEDIKSSNEKIYLICTKSACQRQETLKAYNEDISWYQELLKENEELNTKLVLIYISSQTIYLDSNGFYAKSKIDIEKLLLSSNFEVLILRFGFLLNDYDIPIQRVFSIMNKFNLGFPSSVPNFASTRLKDFLGKIQKSIIVKEKTNINLFDINNREKHINELIFSQKKPFLIFKIPPFIIFLLSFFKKKLYKIVKPNSSIPTANIKLN